MFVVVANFVICVVTCPKNLTMSTLSELSRPAV